MNSYVKYIGILDKNDNIHHVEFITGVNIITGRSSTGKSAMIEIFDYCFGSSEFTIPSGVITDNASLYFVVMAVNDSYIVLGRSPEKNKIFLKDEAQLPDINLLTSEYFGESYFMTDFKENLGRRFGLTIDNTDTDLQDKEYRPHNRKKGRPSVRNMTSFLLQHQNLIANKHSIFFRFDEKEKREQVIDQFKIFSGLVDAEYFSKKQTLADKERTLKELERQQQAGSERKDTNKTIINNLLEEYYSITGKQLFEKVTSENILTEPANYLKKMEQVMTFIDYESNASLDTLDKLNQELNEYRFEHRNLQYKLNNIKASIKYANDYKNDFTPSDRSVLETMTPIECPICYSKNDKISKESEQLNEAISWLNNELSNAQPLIDSFVSDRDEIQTKISPIKKNITNTQQQISRIEEITDKLKRNKNLEEQALKVRLKIENFLEMLIDENHQNHDEKLRKLELEIKQLTCEINTKYNLDSKLEEAEKNINNQMEKIGERFDFEKSYQPINLKFSLESFDLWHQQKNNEKIYLRSMGSGANWLYSHLTLFMSIQYYFCSLKEKSLLPPVLFLDQPSQVYFPTSIKDSEDEFSADKINKSKAEESRTDEDIRAVTNLFDQLLKHCDETKQGTGITPQIIVTDHADNLDLTDGDFEELVIKRWRQEGSGFINL